MADRIATQEAAPVETGRVRNFLGVEGQGNLSPFPKNLLTDCLASLEGLNLRPTSPSRKRGKLFLTPRPRGRAFLQKVPATRGKGDVFPTFTSPRLSDFGTAEISPVGGPFLALLTGNSAGNVASLSRVAVF